VGDVLAPVRAVAFVVDLEHCEVGHEAVGGGAMPVILAGPEEHTVSGADDLDRAVPPATAQPRPRAAVRGIAMSFRVPAGLIRDPGSVRSDDGIGSHGSAGVGVEGDEMPEQRIGTREEWQLARDELAKLETEQAERNEEVKRQRRDLPWVPVEKEYEFDTEDGKKTLAELFDGRSQLLAYNIMFGPDYENGACPGCTNLGDGLDGALVHLNHRDVTLICFSRAPIERMTAYKERMGWQFPYVSTYNTDFPFDFGLALLEERARRGTGLR